MTQHIDYVSLVVRDYDEAIAYFTQMLGFRLVKDQDLGHGRRWVLVAPPGARQARLLLAKASTPQQQARVGDQTGGRVFLFLHTDDFARDYAQMQARGVRFIEAPRHEPYGIVAIFEDLYGNKWDLLQLTRAAAASHGENDVSDLSDPSDEADGHEPASDI